MKRLQVHFCSIVVVDAESYSGKGLLLGHRMEAEASAGLVWRVVHDDEPYCRLIVADALTPGTGAEAVEHAGTSWGNGDDAEGSALVEQQ